MSKLALPVIFRKMTPRVDKSWKLEVETRELSGEDIKFLAEELGTEGYMVYSPNDTITEADVPTGQADSGMEGKTPSQRLRSVLYVLWEQSGKPGTFETFKNTQYEKFIDAVKERLE